MAIIPPPPPSICVITGRVECTGQLSFNWHGKIIGLECEYVALCVPRTGASLAFFSFFRAMKNFRRGYHSRIFNTAVLNQRSCKTSVCFSSLRFFYQEKRLAEDCDPRGWLSPKRKTRYFTGGKTSETWEGLKSSSIDMIALKECVTQRERESGGRRGSAKQGQAL